MKDRDAVRRSGTRFGCHHESSGTGEVMPECLGDGEGDRRGQRIPFDGCFRRFGVTRPYFVVRPTNTGCAY
jgi:hypothetical protein